MKKKILSVLLCLAILFTIAPKPKGYADALTMAMVGQLAYGMASSWGIGFTAGSATGQGMSDYMTGQVESYVNSNGGSLTSLFGGEIARLAAGKLVVGQQLYNGVLGFVDWLKNKYNLDSTGKTLSYGSLSDIMLNEGQQASTEIPSTGYGVAVSGGVNYNTQYLGVGYGLIGLYKDGVRIGGVNQGYGYYFNGTYTLDYVSATQIRLSGVAVNPSNGATRIFTANARLDEGEIKNGLNWSVPENWSAPAPLPQDKQWEGDFSGTPGFAEPPTDLPDFLSRIPVGIANNDLAVTGEIVDAGGGGGPLPSPSPSPGPSPSYNKGAIATMIAEILALINSLSGDVAVDQEAIEEVAQQVAEQAQTVPDTITQIGTQTQTAIQDATQSMTDTITQTQTQIQTEIQDATQTITDTITQTQTQTQTEIQDATQTITDTITQTQTQTQTEIQDATQTITDTITQTQTQTQTEIQDATQTITDSQTEIKDAIEDATDIPTRDKWEQVKKDLHGVFPFCIPWDIYGMLTAFSAEPRAPHFEWPFNVPSIGLEYTIDLDFAEFDPVAQTLRTVELIAFSIGLAILTSKVIRW